MGFYREQRPIIFATQIRVADGRIPEEVIRYGAMRPDGAIGFIGTGDGLQDVCDGDWIIRHRGKPCTLCQQIEFARHYRRLKKVTAAEAAAAMDVECHELTTFPDFAE